MKFGEYLENLTELLQEHPELIDADVIFAADDEGNDYGIVNWIPSVGYFDKQEREFYTEDDDISTINAVLIN
jgi:hypothetical protein